MRILSLLSLVLAAFVLTACAAQRFTLASDEITRPNSNEIQIFIIGGIDQTQAIDAAQICGSANRVQAVEFKLSPLDWLISSLTFNLVTPRTANVYCKGKAGKSESFGIKLPPFLKGE